MNSSFSEFSGTAASLVLIKQSSLAKEKFSKNSILKDVDVVAKTLPFDLEIGSPYNLLNTKFNASLYYDNDQDSLSGFHKVDSIYNQNSLIKYKVSINESGDRATFEMKISALTSQHFDSLFRVHIQIEFPNYNGIMLEVFSNPIKVVSKPSVLTKSKNKKGPFTSTTSPSSPSSPCNDSSPNTSILGKRNVQELHRNKENNLENYSDSLVAIGSCSIKSEDKRSITNMEVMMSRMQAQLELQQQMLTQLMASQIQQQQKGKYVEEIETNDFDKVLIKFVGTLSKMPQHERPLKVRKALQTISSTSSDDLSTDGNSSISNIEIMNEFIDICGLTLPVKNANGSDQVVLSNSSGSQIAEFTWDKFYSEFISPTGEF